MGDANETVEELLWLVWYFAMIAAKVDSVREADKVVRAALDEIYYPMARQELDQDAAYLEVQKRMQR